MNNERRYNEFLSSSNNEMSELFKRSIEDTITSSMPLFSQDSYENNKIKDYIANSLYDFEFYHDENMFIYNMKNTIEDEVRRVKNSLEKGTYEEKNIYNLEEELKLIRPPEFYLRDNFRVLTNNIGLRFDNIISEDKMYDYFIEQERHIINKLEEYNYDLKNKLVYGAKDYVEGIVDKDPNFKYQEEKKENFESNKKLLIESLNGIQESLNTSIESDELVNKLIEKAKNSVSMLYDNVQRGAMDHVISITKNNEIKKFMLNESPELRELLEYQNKQKKETVMDEKTDSKKPEKKIEEGKRLVDNLVKVNEEEKAVKNNKEFLIDYLYDKIEELWELYFTSTEHKELVPPLAVKITSEIKAIELGKYNKELILAKSNEEIITFANELIPEIRSTKKKLLDQEVNESISSVKPKLDKYVEQFKTEFLHSIDPSICSVITGNINILSLGSLFPGFTDDLDMDEITQLLPLLNNEAKKYIEENEEEDIIKKEVSKIPSILGMSQEEDIKTITTKIYEIVNEKAIQNINVDYLQLIDPIPNKEMLLSNFRRSGIKINTENIYLANKIAKELHQENISKILEKQVR